MNQRWVNVENYYIGIRTTENKRVGVSQLKLPSIGSSKWFSQSFVSENFLIHIISCVHIYIVRLRVVVNGVAIVKLKYIHKMRLNSLLLLALSLYVTAKSDGSDASSSSLLSSSHSAVRFLLRVDLIMVMIIISIRFPQNINIVGRKRKKDIDNEIYNLVSTQDRRVSSSEFSSNVCICHFNLNLFQNIIPIVVVYVQAKVVSSSSFTVSQQNCLFVILFYCFLHEHSYV